MGLDNIPRNYACENVAVRDEEGRIDCQKTQECGKCPWKNEFESNPYLKDAGPTYGMFGTDCWYRGKYGEYLVDMLKESVDHQFSFYGEGSEDGDEGLSPEYCFKMAEFMKKYAEEFAYIVGKKFPDESIRYINDYMYATWWLEFVGKNCEGSAVWY